jgi:hypothetical protein
VKEWRKLIADVVILEMVVALVVLERVMNREES